MKSYLDTHLRFLHHSLVCRRRSVVLGPLFLNFGSRCRPKLERSGISGWNAKPSASAYEIISGYPFDICTPQYWLWAKTFSCQATFSQLRVTFQTQVGTKWDYGLKRKTLCFCIWNHIWIPIWELYTTILIMGEDVSFSWRFFSTSGHITCPSWNEVGLPVEKKNHPFSRMKSYLDTHLRVLQHRLDCGRLRVVLGPLFLNFGSRSMLNFERSGITGWK